MKEEFLQEIDSVKNKNIIEEIKNYKLPVIIFGAGAHSRRISNALKNNNIAAAAYAVDANYYKPAQTFRGLPIYNFDELVKKPKDYVFICGLGVENVRPIKPRSRFFYDDDIIKYQLALCPSRLNIDYDFFLQNQGKFWEVFGWLSDNFSKKTLLNYLKANITHNADYISGIFARNDYFNELTRDATIRGGIYVDCGACCGDTIESFIEFANGEYKKIFAFEPDRENFLQLQKLVTDNDYKNIVLCNCGVWDKKETLSFEDGKGGSSHLSENGNVFVNVDSIDNIVGDEFVSLIKMDVEGAELKALKGAVKILERDKPFLAICVYHKSEDLITIPQFIKNIYGNCKLYLRKHYDLTCYELVLYVIPE